MTDCPNGEMRDLLPDLLSGRLDAAKRAGVEAHVASCADCRQELALLRGMRAMLHRAPVVDVGAIVRALPAYEAPARRAVGRSWGGWRAAAAIALAVGGTSLAVARRDHVTGPVAAVAQSPAPVAASAPSVVAARPVDAQPSARVAQVPRSGELAVTGSVADLSDGELAALLNGIESLDAVPAAESESPSLAPATSATTSGAAS